ncbi:MAG TPA: nucleotide exchange factor GrpE [Desulfopila sp.]|nr:nucleotide exchange factor GrpE [Desulfopila sp.]
MSEKERNESIAEEAMDANDTAASANAENTATNCEESSAQHTERLEKELAESNDEVAGLKDKMLRMAADYENYKKRNERERATAMKYAGEHIFREFLPVVDNLERALQQGAVEGTDNEKKLAGLLEGVELTLKSLHTSLDKFEVKAIDSVGELFDPNKQEALTMEPSDTIPPNHVVNEFEKGYFYKDRLLRAAKVTVSSGKTDT